MKKLIFTIVLLSITTFSFAQAPLGKGNAQINFGLGLSAYRIPFYAGLDYGVHKDVTIGGELSFSPAGRTYYDYYGPKNYRYGYRRTVIGLSINGNYHFNTLLNLPSQWNVYAGANLGFYYYNYSYDHDNYYNDHNNSGLGIGLQVGGRYYFNNKVGINLEFGGGNAFSGGKIGLTIKL